MDRVIAECGLDELQALKILHSLLSSGLIKRLDNVYLNWKGNFIDYEGIISLYTDLLKIMEKNLRAEIGQEFYRIYHRSLKTQEEKGRPLLADFNPFIASTPSSQNEREIIKRLAKFVSFYEGKRELLQCFNDVIKTMTEEINIIVGQKLIQKTLNEIYAKISFVGKYQQQKSDINELVLNNLKDSLEKS